MHSVDIVACISLSLQFVVRNIGFPDTLHAIEY